MNKNSCPLIVILFTSIFFSINVTAQIKIYEKFDDFNQEVVENFHKDTTYVVNFWATWCGPCVKELPFFEELNKKYSNTAFKQILVSLDAPKKLESKVIPFVAINDLKSEVVLLADGKYNSWIDRIDPSWSGAIPITLMIRGKQRLFYEREFHSMNEIEVELLKLF